MNYYSDHEIGQVIEEADRLPRPASEHVALITDTTRPPRRKLTGLWAVAFWLLAFLFVLTANMVQLPTLVLGLFAGLLIGVFVAVTVEARR